MADRDTPSTGSSTRLTGGGLRPRIVVFGAGGAGGNAVANMIASGLEGVTFVVANTDAQALERADPAHRLQLGPGITEGLGAGARPDIGRRAAEDSLDDIAARVENAHMVFITAGMGGGTGTGAAPVIARAAREAGALTVAVVTKPFEFEGVKRMAVAEEGVAELEREVDTLIVIPNQNLFRIATEKTTIADAFALADNVLHAGVRGVTDLMMQPGIVNLDFADVRTVMNEMGKAVMGSGEAEGPRRAVDAAVAAMANPLLDDVTLKGAKAVLLNITGGLDLTLYEVDEAANTVRAEVDPEANIIFGSALEERLGDKVRVSIVATGINSGGTVKAARPPSHGLPFADKVAAAGFTFEPPVSEAKPAPAPKPPQAPKPATAAGPVEPWSEPVPDDDEPAGAPPEAALRATSVAPPADEDAAGSDTDLEIRSLIGADDAPEAAADTAERTRPADASDADAADDEAAHAEPVRVRRMTPQEESAARSGGFSLFGRRKRRPESHDSSPADNSEPERGSDAAAESPDEDEDLEIPAFLRRQAN